VFGASGAGGVLVKVTAALATTFFLTSIYLAYASTQRVTGSIFEGNVNLPAATKPVGKTTAPAVPAPTGLPAAPHSPASPNAPVH